MKKRRRITLCPNCQTHLNANDNFCPSDGQENHFHEYSIREVWHDFIGSFMNFDGKLWTTLRTIITQPGQIPKDIVQNRRARYVPLMRFYLFVTFLFFLLSNFQLGNLVKKNNVNAVRNQLLVLYNNPEDVKISRAEFLMLDSLSNEKKWNAADSIVRLKKKSGKLTYLLQQGNLMQYFDSIRLQQKLMDDQYKDNSKTIKITYNLRELSGDFMMLYSKPQFDTLNDEIPLTRGNLYEYYQDPAKLDSVIKHTDKIAYWEKVPTRNLTYGIMLAKYGSPQELENLIKTKFAALISNFSYMMFLMMPLVALLYYLFYFRVYSKYLPHLILSVHIHTLMFGWWGIYIILNLLLMLIFKKLPDEVEVVLLLTFFLVYLVYMLIVFKKFYARSYLRTILKISFLHMIYFFLFTVLFTFLTAFSFIF